jgi:hypothetical protein
MKCWLWLLFVCTSVQAQQGPTIRRVANMPDGAPAFETVNARGQRTGRIECIFNGWYDSTVMAARLMGSQALMAALIAKDGRLMIEDLGSAKFDCVPVPDLAP